MANSKDDLYGSFISLQDTLAFRRDPSSEDVADRWFGVFSHAWLVGRRTNDWIGLPDNSTKFTARITALDAASRALVLAGPVADRLAALDQADRAIDDVEQLLNG